VLLYVEGTQDNAACRESPAENKKSGSAGGIRRNGRGSLASVGEKTRLSEEATWEVAATTEEIVNASTHDLGR
jgi:hypothetical protein